MLEVLREAVAPVNLPFTILLGLVVGYWLLVSIGLLDMDADATPDFHADVHLPHGGGASHAVDLHGASEGFQGTVKSALQFLNIGNVPAMIVLSIMSLSFWTWSMIGNHYFNEGSAMRALVLFAPNLVLTILLTKLLTSPLKRLFQTLNREYEEHKPVVGRTCMITTNEVTDKFGQAQIDTSGAPLLINVRTFGDTILKKGESALIIKEDKENNIYTVAKLTTASTQEETPVC